MFLFSNLFFHRLLGLFIVFLTLNFVGLFLFFCFLFFTLECSWSTTDKLCALELSHLAMLGRMSVGAKALRLVPLSSHESRHLNVKLLLMVEVGMCIVWPETELVDTYRKESDNLKASLNWLQSCLKWFSKLSLWLYSMGFPMKTA